MTETENVQDYFGNTATTNAAHTSKLLCIIFNIQIVKIGHMISPIPRYNSSYLNNSVTHGRNSPGVIGASTMLSPALAAGKSSTISRAGASILNNSNQNLQFTRTSNSKLLPNSFKTALEEVEDEINALAAEVAYQRKESLIMKSEQDTYTDIAKAQHQDIERYLAKECKILDNVSQT